MKNTNCLICDRKTDTYLYMCKDCRSLFDDKRERVVKNFKYIDEAYTCFYYNPFLQENLLKYKFSNKRYLAKLFAEVLIEKIFELGLHREVDLLMSVPVHVDTLIKRGFNQVELLEKYIEEGTKIRASKNNLVKLRATKEQARLTEGERKVNLLGAFSVNRPEEIRGKKILILDDIITTGSTLEECARVLLCKGALEVKALSIASVK